MDTIATYVDIEGMVFKALRTNLTATIATCTLINENKISSISQETRKYEITKDNFDKISVL